MARSPAHPLTRPGAPAAPGRMLFLGAAVLVFALDRVSKALVNASVPLGHEFAAIDHAVFITHVQNSGAAFGLAPVASSVFIGISLIVAAALLVYEFRLRGMSAADAMLGLILGGTLGNGYDRLTANGSVTDFIALHFWPVFNVADSAISLGVVLLLLRYLLRQGAEA